MKNWAIAITVAGLFCCLYFSTSYYFLRSGKADSEAEIKAVLNLADEIYAPIVQGDLLWRFPFSEGVEWRLVRRGSRIDLNGNVSPKAALEFLSFIDKPSLSSATYPVESGNFRLIVEQAVVEGDVDLSTGHYRMRVLPAIARD